MKLTRTILTNGLFLIGLLFVVFHTMTLGVGELRCDYQTTPLAVDSQTPCFGWQLAAKWRSTMQSAYEIEVIDCNDVPIWHSGKVDSEESQQIAYAGSPLAPMQTYCWRVRVWDEHDRASRWSDYTTFTTAPTTAAS